MSHWQPQNPGLSANSSVEENFSAASFTNTSGLSGRSLDSSSGSYLFGEPAQDNLWSQVLLNIGSSEDIQSSYDDGENFLGTFDSACDYLNKLNYCDHKRLGNLSDLVSNCTLTPPNHQFLAPPMPQYYSTSTIPQIKLNLPWNPANLTVGDRSTGNMSYMHENKGESQYNETGAYGLREIVSWTNTKNYSDVKPLQGYLNKQEVDFGTSMSSSNSKKKEPRTSSSTKGSGRGSGTTSEGKRKRPQDTSDALSKKIKLERSAVSSHKLQAPKAKLTTRISALQQLVSPFGKTDTASVLLEAIKHISVLQDQVRLLTDPYMKSSANKDQNLLVEMKGKVEQKLDLRSQGLCLVPTSFIPQVYLEKTAQDYLTPIYRGSLYWP